MNLTSSNQLNNENEIQEHGEFKKENTKRMKSLLKFSKKPLGACSLALSDKYYASYLFCLRLILFRFVGH